MGLAVDYGAHIAHFFLTAEGKDRNQRVEKTLVNIGPAVFNGGFSTFLAFLICVAAK
jgi:Niemann-Pick C1 protein